MSGKDQERDEGDRLRRQAAVMRFLSQMHGMGGERDLMQALIQAAAVWYDLDARAYRRDHRGRFVVDMWLPGAEPAAYPQELECASLIADAGPVRVSSMADLEQLGWHSLQGELLLLPVARGHEIPWLIVIAGIIDREAEANLAVTCRTAGTALEQLSTKQAREVQARVSRRLAEGRGSVSALTQEAFEELLVGVGAARGRLEVKAPGTSRPLTLAIVGGSLAAPAFAELEPGRVTFAHDRIMVTSRVTGGGVAAMELQAFDRVPFTHGQALIAEAGAAVLGTWLSGVTAATGGRVAEGPGEVRPSPTLEDAIGGEMERVKRLSLKGGVLVASFVGGSPGERSVVSLIEAMREELRSSDLLGQLSSGEIAALLVRASAEGVVSAAWRLRQRLEALVREHRLPPIVLGHALYPEGGGESLGALVERARKGALDRPL